MTQRALTLSLVASSAFLSAAAWLPLAGSPPSPPQTSIASESAISFRIRFGMTDTESRSWSGTITTSEGEILRLRNWAPHPSEEIVGDTGWSMATRNNKARTRSAFQKEYHRGTLPYMDYPGVVVDVGAPPGSIVEVKTEQGDFEIQLRQLQARRFLTYLDGAVIVDQVPTSNVVSSRAYANDFATMLDGQEGHPWLAWLAYRDKGNHILARRFNAGQWEPAVRVTSAPADIYLPKMGRDRIGRPWVVWSQQNDGNFDLYGSYWDGERWSRADRLTTNSQPDIEHAMATDSRGNLWLIWQGFRNGKSDIFSRRFDGQSWSTEEKLSRSPANDWQPAIAADGRGNVYVAWDTYDKGNYDIVMRLFSQGNWGEVSPVAETPLFEAHVSLACDNQDRLWASWNESGFQWGKDTGFGIAKEATRLYDSRSIGLAVRERGRWRIPVSDINQSLPGDLQGYNDFPQLQLDGAGLMWVFFRHRHVANPDIIEPSPLRAAAW